MKNGLEGFKGLGFIMSPLPIFSYGSLSLFEKNLYLRKELLKKKDKKDPKGNF